MDAEVIYRTWDDFWGVLLMVQWPSVGPDIIARREARAEWIWRTFSLREGATVLDLGCGNGMVDLHLAHRGAYVTGVDRLETILDQAQAQVGKAQVDFRCEDLRDLELPEAAFDLVIVFEVTGLMSRDDDCDLITRAARWLRPGGSLAIDAPLPSAPGTGTWDLPDGQLTIASTYDPETRLKHIEPTLRDSDGQIIGLHDPYDRSRPDCTGVLRYLYPQSELTTMLARAGLRVQRRPHYANDETYYLLVGEKESNRI